jgi:hypothetical protein
LLFVGSTGSTVTVSTPSGFTQVLRSIYNSPSVGRQVYLFTKTATGSEGATIPVSQSASTGLVSVSCQIAQWSAIEAVGANGSSANPDPASLSPSWGEQNTLWIATAVGRATTLTGYPSGYSNIFDPTVTSNLLIGSAQANKHSASEDPGAFTQNASDSWATITAAIRP